MMIKDHDFTGILSSVNENDVMSPSIYRLTGSSLKAQAQSGKETAEIEPRALE